MKNLLILIPILVLCMSCDPGEEYLARFENTLEEDITIEVLRDKETFFWRDLYDNPIFIPSADKKTVTILFGIGFAHDRYKEDEYMVTLLITKSNSEKVSIPTNRSQWIYKKTKDTISFSQATYYLIIDESLMTTGIVSEY